jgi:CubicO group peptidase (beta-lactamase class C family)
MSLRPAARRLFVLIVGCVAPLAPAALPDETTEKIDVLFREWNGPERPGCSVGVVERGALVFARGYGMANWRTQGLHRAAAQHCDSSAVLFFAA